MITHSLIPRTRLANGGKHPSRAVHNGSGRLESRTELAAAVPDSRESRSVSEAKCVVKSTRILKTPNGTK